MHLLLAQLHAWRGDQGSARRTFDGLMSIATDLNLSRIERSIRDHMGDPSAEVHTTYSMLPGNGVQNLGFYEHVGRSGPSTYSFVTKISTSGFFGNEPRFYTRFIERWPQLRPLAPRMVCFARSERIDVCMLTMEKVDGREPEIANMEVQAVDALVRGYVALLSVDPVEVEQYLLPRPFAIGFNHGYLVQALHGIQEPGSAEMVMLWLETAIRSRGYSIEVQRKILDLVKLMRDGQFNERIRPDLHFTFLHGDLHRYNILQWHSGYLFIDWAHCTTGPAYADLAVLFRRFGFLGTVGILERNGLWSRMDDVGKALFAYSLILVSVMIDIDPIKKEDPEHLFLPAARFMEGVITA
ncbi:MAG: phosphotransferase [Flavobacteriales bacterium]|nr:phosphotransferase [Flavobacteriales bacterium]